MGLSKVSELWEILLICAAAAVFMAVGLTVLRLPPRLRHDLLQVDPLRKSSFGCFLRAGPLCAVDRVKHGHCWVTTTVAYYLQAHSIRKASSIYATAPAE